MKVFISYSHQDEAHLKNIHTHLALLRREGKIDQWHDHKILAGDVIDDAVIKRLDESDIFLALVSPDFIASNYCYEKEMQFAMEKHSKGETRIIPVILEPCEWLSSPLKKFKAIPKDGKPVSEWTNKNTAYLDIISELRRVISDFDEKSEKQIEEKNSKSNNNKRYRVKKDYDDIDKSDFRTKSYEEIKKYFEESIHEINEIEGVKGRMNIIDNMSFCCSIINTMRNQGASFMTIHSRGSAFAGMGDIIYSLNENAPPNQANGGFSIEEDEYDLFFTARIFMGFDNKERLNAKRVAEIMWNTLLDNAGISAEAA